ncbi:MAG: prephenate dehydratase [Lentisphaeria bacterium]
MGSPEIRQLTDKLAKIDENILQLLDERIRVSGEIGKVRRASGENEIAPEELSDLQKRMCALDKRAVSDETVKAVFREIWSGASAALLPLAVAYFGRPATFTHQAAITHFGEGAKYIQHPNISDVFDAVARGQAAYGVVPIENSTEGSVTHTLDMFVDTALKICAEINMPIHHCLLSKYDKRQIKTIYSHPQPLGQCRRWIYRNLPDANLIEVASTSEAAARAAEEPDSSALASQVAADVYGVPIVDRNIEDSAANVTRFFVLGQNNAKATGDDKTSLLMVVRDRVGALYDSLLPFRETGVNLTFIESRPSKRRNWEYYFFVDFTGHVSDPNVKEVLEELREQCQFVKILGSYPRAR